ncbi:MAG: DUF262 domain-containing protein [Sphingobacteriia bacterium]
MKAVETKVEEFISKARTQFVIPVYQRNYDWSIQDCRQLFNDIISAGKNKDVSAHFIGSIVFLHNDVYTHSQITKLTIIDGQQRLTTRTLIYLALRHLFKDLKKEENIQEIDETYLINKFDKNPQGKFKLKVTKNNEQFFKYIYDCRESELIGYSNFVNNFKYFRKNITEDNYNDVRRGLYKLMFVEISLERGKDDPQRIFESLNSTGLALSQADLIRNYILMELSSQDQEVIYEEFWFQIEESARNEKRNENLVSDYIRDYLTLINRRIPNKKNVYEEFKQKYKATSIEKLKEDLSDIKKLSKHFNKLVNPHKEEDKEIRLRLISIKRLEVNVAFPFLMKVYDDYSNQIIDKQVLLEIFDFIESFIVRRFIVSLPTNALNKIFMNLHEKIDSDDYLASIQRHLISRSGNHRFPDDGEVIDALKSKDIYNSKQIKFYLLEKLENHENKEFVKIEDNSDITIEHIFPQNPDSSWRDDLDDEEFEFMKKRQHTISNLTLSGNNGKLGNKSFKEKRDLNGLGYSDSRLWMNKHLSKLERWGKDELEKRFDIIRDRFLEIWKYPDLKLGAKHLSGVNEEISIFDADDPTNQKLEYVVFLSNRIEVTKITDLYKAVFERLFLDHPESFFTNSFRTKFGISHDSIGLRMPYSISDNCFIEVNLSSSEKFKKIKAALTFFELEDELTIKYADS